nr:MAG TPA: tail length tape measure protein [Caudoviricetes sp.]
MAADDGKIKYSELVYDDGAFDKMLTAIEGINKSMLSMKASIQSISSDIAKNLSSVSSSMTQSKEAIEKATVSANNLSNANKVLNEVLHTSNSAFNKLKSQVKDVNSLSDSQKTIVNSIASRYQALDAELKDNIRLFQALNKAEREDAAYGGEVLNTITNLKSQMSQLTGQMKTEVSQIVALQNAQQKLNFLRSEEGQKLLSIRKEISNIVSGRGSETQKVDALTAAQQKLQHVQSEEYLEIQKLNQQIKQQQKEQKLLATVNSSAEGSYTRLAAQYELNKIKLNAMSAAERQSTESGKALEAETKNIYKQMIVLQEATGNHRLSVGNYARTWNGLGNAMNQVVRELPSMAVSMNTFFLAISNNLPILVDEIQNLKEKNKALIAQGKPAQSVMKTILKSIFSWQTAMIIGITILSSHGKEIINWISHIGDAATEAGRMSIAMDNINDKLKEADGNFGQNVVKLKELSRKWSELRTNKEKNQFIRDNANEFKNLGVEVNNVEQAENLLVKNTGAVIKALELRAKAAAATALAQEEYKKTLQTRAEIDLIGKKKEKGGQENQETLWQQLKGLFKAFTQGDARKFQKQNKVARFITGNKNVGVYTQSLITDLKDQIDYANRYFEIASDLERQASKILKDAGVGEYHKKLKKTPKGRTPTDLTATINKNDIDIQKKYEQSITAITQNEYQKRRQEIATNLTAEIGALKEKYRKNEEYVKNIGKKYKALTAEQKKQIENQQQLITKTIANNLKQLSIETAKINAEQKANNIALQREFLRNFQYKTSVKYDDTDYSNLPEHSDKYNLNAATTTALPIPKKSYEDRVQLIKDSLQEELKTLQDALDAEEQLELDFHRQQQEQNIDDGNTNLDIQAKYQKKRAELVNKYNQIIYNLDKKNIDASLELTRTGTSEQLQLQLEQNKLAESLELSANRALPAEQQVDDKKIKKKYKKNEVVIRAKFEMAGFEQFQEFEKNYFNLAQHTSIEIERFELQQEKARWERQIKLAEQGGLDWSDVQIESAELAVKGIDKKLKGLGKQGSGTDIINKIGKYGLGGSLLSSLGFDDNQISAFLDATNTVIEQLQNIAQAEVDLAQTAVDKAKERADAAKETYDAEIEARNNGYANNVATAKKELQQERLNQQKKEQLLIKAQKRQEAINTAVQASNLVTASAILWVEMCKGTGILGPALAIAAIAAMWGSFIGAKIKAAQVSKVQNQEYGEGGLEFLDGGSHASGNDINLQTRNSKGKNMRAEGGEALAIINKRQTRRYKRELPSIIKSLNDGTFEEKFSRAFEQGDNLQQLNINNTSCNITDLSKIEKLINDIKTQNEYKYIQMPDGSMLEISKNVKRIIR